VWEKKQESKTFLNSEIDGIVGVGEKTRIKLISYFKSIKKIESAKEEELTKVVGKKMGKIIYEYFK